MTDPKQLRKDILAQRDLLSTNEIIEKSNIIGSTLLTTKEIMEATNIFIYVNFRSEVQTTPVITKLLSEGKNVSVPLTRVAEKRLEIVRIKDPENELVPGYCAIPEPREELVSARSVKPEAIEVIILPGSVFDTRCGRFGYGGGYYDRLLASIPKAARLALAFELQVISKLPLQEHDELLDGVITEMRELRCAAR